MARFEIHFHNYGSSALARSAFVDPSTINHVSAIISGEWHGSAAVDPTDFPRGLADLALFCDLYCIRDRTCFYLPLGDDADRRFFRSALTSVPKRKLFGDGVLPLGFISIDEEQRARIFSRWNELLRSEVIASRSKRVSLCDPEVEALLLGLLAEEMMQSSAYAPGIETCEAYLNIAPDELEFRTHNLLTAALGRINSAFVQRVETRAALSSRSEPLLPPILALILGKVSKPSEILEELEMWRRKFAPLRRRFADLDAIARSDRAYGAWEKEHLKLQRDVGRFLGKFEWRDRWTEIAGVNPWDVAEAGETRSSDGWTTELSLKLSAVVKVGAELALGALRRRRMRPLPQLESRLKRLRSLNGDLQRVFGRGWSSQDDLAFRVLVATQKRAWRRRSKLPVDTILTSRPTFQQPFLPSLLKADSLVDEFVCRLHAHPSELGRAQAVLNIGRIALEDEDLQRGEFYVRAAMSRGPKSRRGKWRELDATGTFAIAQALAAIGQPGKAEEVLERALARSRDGWILAEYGAFLATRGDERAMTLLREAVRVQPKIQPAWFNLALLLSRGNKQEEAIVCAREAAHLSGPHAGQAWQLLGCLLLERKDFAGATEALNEASNLLPSSAETWADLASTLGATGDIEGAAKAAAKANDINPTLLDESEWAEDCALWALRAGDCAGALRLLQPLVNAGSAGAHALRIYAFALEGMGDLEGARKMLRTARAKQPRDPESLSLLYGLESRAGEWKRALRAARSLSMAFPEQARAHAMAGDALLALGRHSDAAISFAHAGELGMRDPLKFYNVACDLERDGSFRSAIQFHHLEIAINGEYAPAYANMAADYCELGDIEAALSNAGRAVALEPDDPMNIHILANVHLIRDDHAPAAELLRRLISLPSTPQQLREAASQNLIALAAAN